MLLQNIIVGSEGSCFYRYCDHVHCLTATILWWCMLSHSHSIVMMYVVSQPLYFSVWPNCTLYIPCCVFEFNDLEQTSLLLIFGCNCISAHDHLLKFLTFVAAKPCDYFHIDVWVGVGVGDVSPQINNSIDSIWADSKFGSKYYL